MTVAAEITPNTSSWCPVVTGGAIKFKSAEISISMLHALERGGGVNLTKSQDLFILYSDRLLGKKLMTL